MDAFEVHRQPIGDCRESTEGFVPMHDPRAAGVVAREVERGARWPDPWLRLNQYFASGGRFDELVGSGLSEREGGPRTHPTDANLNQLPVSTALDVEQGALRGARAADPQVLMGRSSAATHAGILTEATLLSRAS